MICVVMTTYAPVPERAQYAHRVLNSLIKFIKPGTEQVRLHVADDGSPEPYNKFIEELMAKAGASWKTPATWSNAERCGIGASLNRALEWVESDLWMYITDDWLLTEPLYLDRAARIIRSLNYDMVRLGPIHPNLSATTRYTQELGWWLDLHQAHGGYVFATRPFLSTKAFNQRIGPFVENENAYEVERIYAETVARSDAKIASITIKGPWQHLGQYEVGTIVPNGTVQNGHILEKGKY